MDISSLNSVGTREVFLQKRAELNAEVEKIAEREHKIAGIKSFFHVQRLIAKSERKLTEPQSTELLRAITDDQDVRGCTCRIDSLRTLDDPINFESGLRFFCEEKPERFPVLDHTLRAVILHNQYDPSRDYCWCDKNPLRGTTTRRKRSVEDTEVELISQNFGEDIGTGVGVVRGYSGASGIATKANKIVQSMWSFSPATLTDGFKAMKAIGGYITACWANLGNATTKLRRIVTEAHHEAVETRELDATGRNAIVKRFKRQIGPLEVAVENDGADELVPSPFDGLPFFAWAKDPCAHIGREAIQALRDSFAKTVRDLEEGHVVYASSIDKIEGAGQTKANIALSINIHKLMLKNYGSVSEVNHDQARRDWGTYATRLVEFMDGLYLDRTVFNNIKAKYRKPPARLTIGPIEIRMATRATGDFLFFLLHEGVGLQQIPKETLMKIVVDIDAIHKQEPIPSLVSFPGKDGKSTMPGDIYQGLTENVTIDELEIEPVYNIKHPVSGYFTSGLETETTLPVAGIDNRAVARLERPVPSRSPSTPRAKKRWPRDTRDVVNSARPKGILKQPKKWPEYARPAQVVDLAMRGRRIRFDNPVAFFRPPVSKPATASKPAVAKDAEAPCLRSKTARIAVALSQASSQRDSSDEKVENGDGTQRDLLPGPQPEKDEQDGAVTAAKEANEQARREKLRRRLELFVEDLQIDESGRIVPIPSLGRPQVSGYKRADLEIHDQLKMNMEEAARREAIAREQRRREEEEARRRREEEEERRAAEEQQRQKEEDEYGLAGLRGPNRPLVGPISQETQQRVMRTQSAAPTAELARTLEGTALTRRDFAKVVPPTEWLNDDIIIGSLLHLAKYVNDHAGATDSSHPKCAAMTSFFWTRLVDRGPTQCGRLMRQAGIRKDNLLDIDTILIPICQSNHWTLAIVCPSKRTVAHMDSMGSRGAGQGPVTDRVLDWLKVTLEEKWVQGGWRVAHIFSPQQRNGWDCGVFTITNAMCVALGLSPVESYSGEDMRLQRLRLAGVLLKGGFEGEFSLEGL